MRFSRKPSSKPGTGLTRHEKPVIEADVVPEVPTRGTKWMDGRNKTNLERLLNAYRPQKPKSKDDDPDKTPREEHIAEIKFFFPEEELVATTLPTLEVAMDDDATVDVQLSRSVDPSNNLSVDETAKFLAGILHPRRAADYSLPIKKQLRQMQPGNVLTIRRDDIRNPTLD